MDSCTRIFTLEQTRSSDGAIVEATGRTGFWPFRRAISYHVGVNCDAISIGNGRLNVLRHGRPIAFVELIGAPSPLVRRWRAAWKALLHPRQASKDASTKPAGDATEVRWEQLLQPRDRNKG